MTQQIRRAWGPAAGATPPGRTSVDSRGCARYVGRLGALAVALGIGVAIASLPALAYADETDPGATTGEDSSSQPSTGPSKRSAPDRPRLGPTNTSTSDAAAGSTTARPDLSSRRGASGRHRFGRTTTPAPDATAPQAADGTSGQATTASDALSHMVIRQIDRHRRGRTGRVGTRSWVGIGSAGPTPRPRMRPKPRPRTRSVRSRPARRTPHCRMSTRQRDRQRPSRIRRTRPTTPRTGRQW